MTDVLGPIRVTHAFLPLLRAARYPRIVNVSSGVGSFQRILEPGSVENAVTLPVYPATKAIPRASKAFKINNRAAGRTPVATGLPQRRSASGA